MITDELLLANGYRQFEDKFYHADCLYQKRMRDEDGDTMYFICFYKYTINGKVDYEVELHIDKGDYTMKTHWYCLQNLTLADIEDMVYQLWVYEGSPYYEKE